MSVTGHAEKPFEEADIRLIVLSGATIDRDEVGHLVHVVDAGKVADVNGGLVPFVVPSVVAVLDKVTTAVDGINHLLGIASRPTAQLGGCGWDVAYALWAEVGHQGFGARCRRPFWVKPTRIDFVDTPRGFAVLGQETAYGGDGDHEPLVAVPARSRQRMAVVILVRDGVGIFVFYLFADEE